MKKITTDILIIGAGPAGLAAAMELSKAKKDFIIVERAPVVGGLSKTYEFKEGNVVFRTDNGPHRFFSKNPYLYEWIEGILNEKWIQVRRQTRQFIDGKFYDYPVNALQALKNVGIVNAFRMGFDYIVAKIVYKIFRKPIRNFADYVYANFGKTLGEFNMINYTEKIWGIPATDIHADWAGQRIKGLNLTTLAKDMVVRLFGKKGANQPKSLVDTFYYPEYGTGLIYETIVAQLKEKGYQILTSTVPKVIMGTQKGLHTVRCGTPEGELEVTFNTLVESIPVPQFLGLLDPKPPEEIQSAHKHLRYRSQTYLFITLNKESITADQWIYFPKKDIPFGRVSEMKNFSDKMSPKGMTSLFIEFFCFENDEVWNMEAEELFEYALPHFEKMGFFKRTDVRKYYRLRERNVYPIYDLEYTEYLNKIKKYLDRFSNLYYIGRPGRFRYNNQDHSLEMGMLAAKSIIDGVKYDLEKVGDEKEYYESGKLYSKDKKD